MGWDSYMLRTWSTPASWMQVIPVVLQSWLISVTSGCPSALFQSKRMTTTVLVMQNYGFYGGAKTQLPSFTAQQKPKLANQVEIWTSVHPLQLRIRSWASEVMMPGVQRQHTKSSPKSNGRSKIAGIWCTLQKVSCCWNFPSQEKIARLLANVLVSTNNCKPYADYLMQ
jgi:hypothetical protein